MLYKNENIYYMKYILKRENLNINKNLIMLDMDETMINSVSKEDIINFHIDVNKVKYEYEDFGDYITFIRPHLDEFLEYLFNNFEVGVWTAGDETYAKPILKYIFKDKYKDLKHIMFKHNTEYINGMYIKDLDTIQKDNIYLIDDKEESCFKQSSKLIRIKPFLMYNKNDNYLLDMIDKLNSKFG